MKFTTVSSQTRIAFENKIEEVLNICRRQFGRDIPTIPLKFSQIGRRAGVCHCGWNYMTSDVNVSTSYLVINPDYLTKYWDDMLNDTCPHEVAHYVAAFIYGKKAYNHGPYWKNVMARIGIPAANRCHTYDTEGVKIRNTHRDYKYNCGCSGNNVHMLTKKKHERHQWLYSNGYKGLRCSKCKQIIVYNGFNYNGTFIPATKNLIPKNVELAVPAAFVLAVNPQTPIVSEPTTRTVTRFVNGMLMNVQVPVGA